MVLQTVLLSFNCSVFCKEWMGINWENADLTEESAEDIVADADQDIDVDIANFSNDEI